MSAGGRPRITVLLSGTGRSLKNLIDRRAAGRLEADIVKVVSTRAGAGGLVFARDAGIPAEVVARRSFADAESFGRSMTSVIEADAPDLVVMAGFLSYYPLPDQLLGRVINIHPSLLPLFGGRGYYGRRVHDAVLAAGMRISGCTVHFVDDQYDHGPIIIQRACPVHPGDDADTLAARVFAEELEALPHAIEWIGRGLVRYDAGRTWYAPELSNG